MDDQVRIGEEVQVSDHDELWTSASQALRDQVSEAVWFSTFQDAVALPAGPRVLRLGVPSAQVRDRILTRYFSLLRLALDEIDGDDIEIEVEVAAPTEHVPDPPAVVQQTFDELVGVAAPAGNRAGLNPRYTFETFVKGTSNQFALAAP